MNPTTAARIAQALDNIAAALDGADLTEYVQDQTTNNVHYRGTDREDGSPTALCNRRYRVYTYANPDAQDSLRHQFQTWGRCPRCEAKAGRGTD